MDQAGRFVYAYGGGQVFAYTIQAGTGQLSPVTGSPFGAGPPTPWFDAVNRIAVDQSNKFLYVSTSAGIVGYNIDPNTGALSMISGSPFGRAPQPFAIVVIPGNQFLYESTDFSTPNGPANLYGYSIDQNTGVLTEIAGSPFAGANCGPIDNMTMAAQGKFLFSNCGSFLVNASSGALTLASSFSPGDWPVIDPSGNFLWAITTDQNCWHCDQGPSTYQVDANTGMLTLVPNSLLVMQNSMTGAVISLAITK